MNDIGCFYRAVSQGDSPAVWHEMTSQEGQLGPLFSKVLCSFYALLWFPIITSSCRSLAPPVPLIKPAFSALPKKILTKEKKFLSLT
jgi:hypothetical protein